LQIIQQHYPLTVSEHYIKEGEDNYRTITDEHNFKLAVQMIKDLIGEKYKHLEHPFGKDLQREYHLLFPREYRVSMCLEAITYATNFASPTMKQYDIPYSTGTITKGYWRKELGDFIRSLYDDPDRRVKNAALAVVFEDETDAQKLIKRFSQKPIKNLKDGNEDKEAAGDDEGKQQMDEDEEGDGDEDKEETYNNVSYTRKHTRGSYTSYNRNRNVSRGRGRGRQRREAYSYDDDGDN